MQVGQEFRLTLWSLLAFVLLAATPKALANTDSFIRLGGYYSYSRLERASTVSGGSFSLISQSGYQGQLVIGKHVSRAWNVYLAGMYFAHDYKAPSSRTIEMPQLPTWTGSLGSEIGSGDITFYLQGNYRTLPLLEDVAANSYKLHAVAVGSAQGGLRFKAQSAYGYEMEVDLSGGTGVSQGQVALDNSAVQLTYTLQGRAQLAFGSRKTVGVSSIRFGGASGGLESRYGLNLEILVDEFKNSDSTYTMTHLYGGLFLALIL